MASISSSSTIMFTNVRGSLLKQRSKLQTTIPEPLHVALIAIIAVTMTMLKWNAAPKLENSRSRKQTIVARSITEAEYCHLALLLLIPCGYKHYLMSSLSLILLPLFIVTISMLSTLLIILAKQLTVQHLLVWTNGQIFSHQASLTYWVFALKDQAQ
ncbi:hypothetical protein CR513_34819, partial [Mucuna pruriens]